MLPMQAFGAPGGVSPIVERGTLPDPDQDFIVAIPASNFGGLLSVSPGSLYLRFTLAGGGPVFDHESFVWAGFSLGPYVDVKHQHRDPS